MSNPKRLFVSTIVVGAVMGGVTFATASSAAAAVPVGGCAGGGFLAKTTEVLPALDNGNTHDQNGDGWLCGRVNRGQSNKNDAASFGWKDNTKRLPSPLPPAGQTVCESWGGNFVTTGPVLWVCNGLPQLEFTDRPFNVRFNALDNACGDDGGRFEQQIGLPQTAACFVA